MYVPPKHGVHVPPLLNHASHTQAVTAVLPAGESEFVGQSSHIEEPVAALYVPPKHGVHVPPSGPLDPVLQVHEALPANELENAEQFVQDEEPDPGAVVYLPATQPTQSPLGPVQPPKQTQSL